MKHLQNLEKELKNYLIQYLIYFLKTLKQKTLNILPLVLYLLQIKMELTKKSLLKHCRELNMYSTPELNDKLYLHQKGICKIENLDEYIGLKVLWLQTNGIEIIEGLNNLIQLKHLYLNENMIKSINGEKSLNTLINLDTLNLEKNYISEIQENDLSKLMNLNTLNLSFNRLRKIENLYGLLNCPSISILDLKNNGFEVNIKFIDEILSKLPNLAVLYLMSSNNKTNENTVSDELNFYRKIIIGKCKNLRHLDDRPVFEDERRCCNAFINGGIEKERLERQKIRNEKLAKEQANHDAFKKLIKDAIKNNNNNDNDDESSDDDDDDYVDDVVDDDDNKSESQ